MRPLPYLIVLSLMIAPGCAADDKPDDDTGSEADADADADTGVSHDDYHVFSVVADVPFEHFDPHIERGEETLPRYTDPPTR